MRDGRERAPQDGRARRARATGAGWARGVWTGRPWLEKASGRRAGSGYAHDSRMRAAVGKENVAVFFLRNHVVLKVDRRRPVGLIVGRASERAIQTGTRLDERPCASIIIFF